ncbi:heat shock protein beta-1-like [Silurus asotus]|uniref:Heat shock protein beta-1-like n=1 Tax=Silurus asotus TaxID=30991 RepID=A0AAD5ABR0_SILAS|nr:heat shock protein beta-1-like [Silurus asotus]
MVAKDEIQMCCDTQSHPPGYGWQPSLLYNQHFGLPPIMDFRDLTWMEGIFRKLHTSSWPGYSQAPGFAQISPKVHREVGGGVSEVSTQQNRWTVTLDVNHFAPSDITVRTQGGFLEIEGKHNERQDEHGYISRFFLRKYKLPAGIEVQSIRTCVTGDGVLTIEAALPDIATPADVTIPVQAGSLTLSRVFTTSVLFEKSNVVLSHNRQRRKKVETEALVSKDQKQDGHQPEQTEIAEEVISTPAEKPEGDTSGTDEMIQQPSGLTDAPESVEGQEAIPSQQDGEMREEQKVDVADSAAAKEEVLDSKTEDPQAPQVSQDPETVTSEMESEIQAKEEKEQIQKVEVEEGLLSREAEGQLPGAQEEIPFKNIKQAEEQVEHVK